VKIQQETFLDAIDVKEVATNTPINPVTTVIKDKNVVPTAGNLSNTERNGMNAKVEKMKTAKEAIVAAISAKEYRMNVDKSFCIF